MKLILILCLAISAVLASPYIKYGQSKSTAEAENPKNVEKCRVDYDLFLAEYQEKMTRLAEKFKRKFSKMEEINPTTDTPEFEILRMKYSKETVNLVNKYLKRNSDFIERCMDQLHELQEDYESGPVPSIFESIDTEPVNNELKRETKGTTGKYIGSAATEGVSEKKLQTGLGPAPTQVEPEPQYAEAYFFEQSTPKVNWRIDAGPAPVVHLPKPIYASATLPTIQSKPQWQIGAGPAPTITVQHQYPEATLLEPNKAKRKWQIGAGPAPTQSEPEPQYAEATLLEPTNSQVHWQIGAGPAPTMPATIYEHAKATLVEPINIWTKWQVGAGPAPTQSEPEPQYAEATLFEPTKQQEHWQIGAGPAPTQSEPEPQYAEASLFKQPKLKSHWRTDAGPEPVVHTIHATATLSKPSMGSSSSSSYPQNDEALTSENWQVGSQYDNIYGQTTDLDQPSGDNVVAAFDEYDTDDHTTPSTKPWATLGQKLGKAFDDAKNTVIAKVQGGQTTTSSSADNLLDDQNQQNLDELFWKEFGRELQSGISSDLVESNVQEDDYNIQSIIDANPDVPGFDWQTFSEKLAAEYNKSKTESSTVPAIQLTTIPPGFWKNIKNRVSNAYTNAKIGLNYINPLSNPGPKKKPVLNVDKVDQTFWAHFEEASSSKNTQAQFWQGLDDAVQTQSSKSTTPESLVKDYDFDDYLVVLDDKPKYVQPAGKIYPKKVMPLAKSEKRPVGLWTRGSDFVTRQFKAAKQTINKAANDVRATVFGNRETTTVRPRGFYWTNYKNHEVIHSQDAEGHAKFDIKTTDPKFLPANKLYNPLDQQGARRRRHADDSQQSQNFDLSQNLESQGFQLSASRSSHSVSHQASGGVDRQKIEALQDFHNFQINQGRGRPRYTSSLNFQIGGNAGAEQSSHLSSTGQQTVDWDQNLGQQTQDFSAGLSQSDRFGSKPKPSFQSNGQQTVNWDQDLDQLTQQLSAGLTQSGRLSNKPLPNQRGYSQDQNLGQQSVNLDQDLGQLTQEFSLGVSESERLRNKPKPNYQSNLEQSQNLGQQTVNFDQDLGQLTQQFSLGLSESERLRNNPKPNYQRQSNSGQQTVNLDQDLGQLTQEFSVGVSESERLRNKPKPNYQSNFEQIQSSGLGQQTVDLDLGQQTQDFSVGLTQSERLRNKPNYQSNFEQNQNTGQQTVNWDQELTQQTQDLSGSLTASLGQHSSRLNNKPTYKPQYDQSEYLSQQTQNFQSGSLGQSLNNRHRPMPTYKPNYETNYDGLGLGQETQNFGIDIGEQTQDSRTSYPSSQSHTLDHKPPHHPHHHNHHRHHSQDQEENSQNLGQETVNIQQPEDYQISELSGGVKGHHSNSFQQPEDYQLSLLSKRTTPLPPFIRFTKSSQQHNSQKPEDLTWGSQHYGSHQQGLHSQDLSQQSESFQLGAGYQQSPNQRSVISGSYQKPEQDSQQSQDLSFSSQHTGSYHQGQQSQDFSQQSQDLSQNFQSGSYQAGNLDDDSQRSSQSLLQQSQIGQQESSNSYLKGLKGNAEFSGQLKTPGLEMSLNATVTEKPGFWSRVGGKVKDSFKSAKDSVVGLVSSKD